MKEAVFLTMPKFVVCLKKISRVTFRKVLLTFVIFAGNSNLEGML